MSNLYEKVRSSPRIWIVFVGLVGILGSTASIISFVAQKDVHQNIYASFICIFFVIAMVLIFIQEAYYHRIRNYSNSYDNFHMVFHNLRDAWYLFNQDGNPQLAHTSLEQSLTQFAFAFTCITGKYCRACIKIQFVTEPDTQQIDISRVLAVDDYCRCNSSSSSDRKKSGVDWVQDNTDFNLIHNKKVRYFFSNNICKYPNYKNSHYTPDDIKKKRVDYFSTIVWPIRKKEDKRIIGYLCIDSPRKDIFIEDIDFAVGACYADCLYMYLQPLFTGIEKEKREDLKAPAT